MRSPPDLDRLLDDYLSTGGFQLVPGTDRRLKAWTNGHFRLTRNPDRGVDQVLLSPSDSPGESYDVLGVVGYILKEPIFETDIAQVLPTLSRHQARLNHLFSVQGASERAEMEAWVTNSNRLRIEHMFAR